MAVQVYTFHITYEGLENVIWRDVEVSSNYRLDQLGYVVLAAFDTLAYHLFQFDYKDGVFVLPSDEFDEELETDVAFYKLHQLSIKTGDSLKMIYDFGTEQVFHLELTGIREMGRGQGRRYPQVVTGAGTGIIDDMHWTELKELIDQIDRKGKTDEPIYYNGRQIPWDYRLFDLEYYHVLLKGIVDQIEDGYAPFWE